MHNKLLFLVFFSVAFSNSLFAQWKKGSIIDKAGNRLEGYVLMLPMASSLNTVDEVQFKREKGDTVSTFYMDDIDGVSYGGSFYRSITLVKDSLPHLYHGKGNIHNAEEFGRQLHNELTVVKQKCFALTLVNSEFSSLFYSFDTEAHFYLQYRRTDTIAFELSYHYMVVGAEDDEIYILPEYRYQLMRLGQCGCFDGSGEVLALAENASFNENSILEIVILANKGRQGIKFFPADPHDITRR